MKKTNAKKILAMGVATAVVASTAAFTACSNGIMNENSNEDISTRLIDVEDDLCDALTEKTNYNIQKVNDISINLPAEGTEATSSWTIVAEAVTNRNNDITLSINGTGADTTLATAADTALNECVVVSETSTEKSIDDSKIEEFISSVTELVEKTNNVSFDSHSVTSSTTTSLSKDQLTTWLARYYTSDIKANAAASALLSTNIAEEASKDPSSVNNTVAYSITLNSDGYWYASLAVDVNGYTYTFSFNVKNNAHTNDEILNIITQYILEDKEYEGLTLGEVGYKEPNNAVKVLTRLDEIKLQANETEVSPN